MSEPTEKAPETAAEDAAQRLRIDVSDDAGRNLIKAKLVGRLDVFTYRELASKLESHYENRPRVKLIIDLAEVPFVASSGWSVFIAMRARFKRVDGQLALVGMNDDLRRIYVSMKMPELIPAFASVAEAEAAMAKA